MSMTNKKERLFKPKGGQASTGVEPQTYKNTGMGGGELLKKVGEYGIIIKNKQRVLVYGK